ncbi:MAG: PhoU family transcriptional regulator [Campylobacterota bacterium]|nr:PhoU family transcriptional regulator [Campylobacterota bacterium]
MLANYKEKLNEIRSELKNVLNGLVVSNELILESLKKCDIEKFEEAKQTINNSSQKTSAIDHDIITTLALHQPEARDLRTMVSYLKITNELLRATSNTRSYIKGFQVTCQEVDIKAINEYAIPMQKATIDALKNTYEMIDCDCDDEAKDIFNIVLIAENKTDDLYEMMEQNILKDIKDVEDYAAYKDMLSVLRKSEKIADRAMSIASLLLFARVGGDIHQS